MRKSLRCVLCAVLAVAMLAGVSPAVEAKGKKQTKEPTVIHIADAGDLRDLAANCSLDTWSDNVRVVLDNDISLAGEEFSSIPIFNGVFDGAGHMICDLDLTLVQSPCGLFLETGEKADIRDLTVRGTVSPGEDDEMVGGIVGRNRGAVTACIFHGKVSGKSRVGGIVGQNEPSGLVTGCVSSGTVRAVSLSGGVAGQNLGTLLACQNKSFVNTEVMDPTLRLDQIDTSSLVNLYRSVTTDTADITTDIGGVAGGNEGFIEQCRNDGTVGYLHIGYNAGGIAGRNSGSIRGCTNNADVYGRRNVGGVVGRAEPMVEVSQAQNLIAGLSYRMAALNHSVDAAIRDAGEDAGDLANQLSGLTGFLTPVHQAVAGLDIENPDSFLRVRQAVTAAVNGISGKLGSLSKDVDSGNRELLRDMQNVSDNLNALSGAAMQTVYALSGAQKNEDILSDDSVSQADTIILGKIADSTNEGEVRGDSNAGGIAGALTIRDDTGLDDLTGGKNNNLIQNRYSYRAVIGGCVNRSAVTAKRECAGGICGRMDLGLVTNCAGYGSVALEDGDYAGGICGLSYASVHNCCAKCTLDGNRYVGGILGNGTDAANSEEHPSSVSGCYALVNILGKPQFSGAISGGGAGEYQKNFFVPAGFAGMDKLSIHGLAEPMDFTAFAKVKGLPEECRSFTLSFVVDGETVKTIPFEYGASFDRSVFPTPEKRRGAYPVWDRTDLTDLRFDTVVSAEYRTDKTALGSDLTREDGRSAVYAEGQFQEGDTLSVSSLPVPADEIERFREPWQQVVGSQIRAVFSRGRADDSLCTEVEERLRICFPEDGETHHTVRLLTDDGSTENHRIYLSEGDGWKQLATEKFGSYLTFTVSGPEATVEVVRTVQTWWFTALGALGVLILGLLVLLLTALGKKLRAGAAKNRERTKDRPALSRRKKALRLAAALLAAALLLTAGVKLATGRLGASLAAAGLLKDLASEETDIRTDIVIRTGERATPISTTVHRVRAEGRMISCVDRFEIPLYISEGQVYLENGRAFRLSGSHLDQGSLMELAREVFLRGEIKKSSEPEDVVYSAELRDETAGRLLEMLLGSEYGDLIRAEGITARLTAVKGKLTELSFDGEGVTESGAAFSVTADLKPEPMSSRPEIPRAVLTAMSDGGSATELLTEDLLSLFSAWMKYDDADGADALMTMRAEGGILDLRTDCDYYFRRVGEERIHCVSSPLFTVYFTDRAACGENGQPLLREQNSLADAARLIDAARELFQKGRCSCEHRKNAKIFSLSLADEDAKVLAETLLPELKNAGISYGETTVRLTVEDGALASIEFRSAGAVKIVTREVDTAIQVSIRFTEPGEHTIPLPVRDALLNGQNS